MKETVNRPLAFSFGDYEGVRVYLNRLARQGWELTGRAGLLTGRFRRTERRELRYDVVPADPRRSEEALRQSIQIRREAGWEPVDTIWGMDIYKSLPCQAPEPFRSEEDCRAYRLIFRDWLVWSAAFLLVTLACLLVIRQFTGVGWSVLSRRWYLSDSKTALCLALPLEGALALLWLVWLAFCLFRRCRPHAPSSQVPLFLRGGLQVLAFVLFGAVLVVLWVEQIPWLWVRLMLVLLFLALPALSWRLGRDDRKKRVRALGIGVFGCFLISMVLGWTLSPVSYSTLSHGSGWRTGLDRACVLRAEDLELNVEGQEVTAFYQSDASLLVQVERYSESWSGGTDIEVTVYTCLVPPLADIVLRDLLPANSVGGGTAVITTTGEDGWNYLWYREGRQIVCLAGTPDWRDEQIWERAVWRF